MLPTEKIWADFNRELSGFIRKRVKDKEAARDILQDVFLKIHLRQHTLKDETRLVSWIYQITRNTLNDHFRAQKNFADLPDLLDEQDEKNYNEEFARCIMPFVDQLPGEYRDAILQTELGSLSQKEYAARLQLSYTGAKSRVQRARHKLLDMFTGCCTIHSDQYGNIYEVGLNPDCPGC